VRRLGTVSHILVYLIILERYHCVLCSLYVNKNITGNENIIKNINEY